VNGQIMMRKYDIAAILESIAKEVLASCPRMAGPFAAGSYGYPETKGR
jgi:hypothetical protein